MNVQHRWLVKTLFLKFSRDVRISIRNTYITLFTERFKGMPEKSPVYLVLGSLLHRNGPLTQ